MIGAMIGYLWWRGCTSIFCTLLYGFAVICAVLFIGVIFSMMVFMSFAENRDHRSCGYLDVLQLDMKIKNGDIMVAELDAEAAKIKFTIKGEGKKKEKKSEA